MALTQIESGGIKDDAVTAGKIPANAVGSSEIADDAVGSAQIADDAIVAAAIADDAVGSAAIADDAIVAAAIADDAVGAAAIADDAVGNAQIADDAVGQHQIADNAINPDRLEAGAVTAPKLAGTLDLSGKTVTLPAASVTAHVTSFDDTQIQNNIAMLGFKVAAANDLTKFSLVDQVIDEFEDASGIDAGASTNEKVASGTVYGETTATPTRSGNWDTTGTDGDYTWWKWTTVRTDGTFTTSAAQNYEYLVVGAGGGGGNGWSNDACGSGGGAGAYRAATGFAIAAGTLNGISVGSGQPAQTPGGDSVLSTITSNGGGGGASHDCQGANANGGNGSSSGRGTAGETCGPSTDAGAYGNNGGSATGGGVSQDNASCGGGGGAGGVGGNGAAASVGGSGGVGLQNDIDGTNRWYAAGGGGASTHGSGTGQQNSIGGNGASTGNQAGGDAVDGTGSGGGGASNIGGASKNGGSGGDGVVIIRTDTTTVSPGGNLTLQSTATTAEAAPTKADLIVLMENAAGTATINTDLKGYISRNGSAFSSAVTFVDEGTWGTNKKIYAAHDVDISGITSGTSMKYKLETLNQAHGSKETKVHAVSLGWR